MANSPTPITHEPTSIRELHWSPAEKVAARRAYHLALSRELENVMREAKEQAARIEEISELWELEHWLTERRREIDRKYDYRYSVLPQVFAVLLRDGWLSEADLGGIGQDKIDRIRHAAHL
ncbi:MAG: hypothetical protein ACYCOR_16185 [Acidobacteriaceae bacterium]